MSHHWMLMIKCDLLKVVKYLHTHDIGHSGLKTKNPFPDDGITIKLTDIGFLLPLTN